MLVADARYIKEYMEELLPKSFNKQTWKNVKKYVNYYFDCENKYYKFSQKEYNKVVKQISKYEDDIRWIKNYNDIKSDLQMLLKHKAREQIYLQLKNKS